MAFANCLLIDYIDFIIMQSEQKRFLQQHKQRSETYSKAAAMMKKQRKKSRASSKTGLAMDKELKVSNPILVHYYFIPH